jgi:hypothetical protein
VVWTVLGQISPVFPLKLSLLLLLLLEHAVAKFVEAAGRSWVRFPMLSLEFFIDIILSATTCPGAESVPNENVYQEYILGVKAAGA